MKKSIIALNFILLGAFCVFAQTELPPPEPPPTLDVILNKAEAQTEFYRETFRNLLADEVKNFEDFDKNGESKKQGSVKSSFLVYQSGKNAKTTAELRNVLEVNGKLVPDSQKRGEEFLGELDKQTTLESELKKLEKESSKYDTTYSVYGLTLNEGVSLAPSMRPFFDYKLQSAENYQGNDVYIVSYQQTKKNPNISFDDKIGSPNELYLSFKLDLPGSLKKEGAMLRGKLWIDAKTFQIRREEQELTAQTAQPIVVISNVFDYQTSDYGILVPKHITLTIFNVKKEKDGKKYYAVKDTNLGFDYSKFRQTNVDVKILDDEPESK